MPLPTDYAGLWGWWKPDEFTYTEGQDIENWDDASANDYDLTWVSVGSGLVPSYHAEIQNGIAVATFDGVFDRLRRGEGNPIPMGSSGSIFAVASFDDFTGAMLVSGGTGSSGSRYFFFRPTSVGFLSVEQQNGGTIDRVRGDDTLNANQFYILEAHSNGTAWSLYVQNEVQTLTVESGANSGDWFADVTGMFNLTVGASDTSGHSNFFDGYLGELIIYDGVTLTADERQDVYDYLYEKWFIPPDLWGWAGNFDPNNAAIHDIWTVL